jgi:hypothetical protein
VANLAGLLSRVRFELGDTAKDFRDEIRGNGDQESFDLSAVRIEPTSLQVFRENADHTRTAYLEGTHWDLDAEQGIIHWYNPPARDDIINIEGKSYGIFSDAELSKFVTDALAQHLQGRSVKPIRYRDGHGFIRYDRDHLSIETLPAEEEVLVAMLATVEALWALSTEASLDINVQTTEGTVIPRGQRFQQIQAQIGLLLDRYKELSMLMGVGIYAPEVLNVRRVSRTTGRLVPIYVDREYDEYSTPVRVLPPVPNRDADPDGPPSPAYPGYY